MIFLAVRRTGHAHLIDLINQFRLGEERLSSAGPNSLGASAGGSVPGLRPADGRHRDCAGLTLILPVIVPVRSLFGFAPVPALQLAGLVAIDVLYVAATEAAKRWFYRNRP